MEATTYTNEFTIVRNLDETGGYHVLMNGFVVTDRLDRARTFKTRNSARKAITRLRRYAGDRHR